jgi:hypothetical protein
MGTGSFPGLQSGRGVTLTPHPLLVPSSRKGRFIPLLPLWAVRPVQSLSACTRVHFTLPLTKETCVGLNRVSSAVNMLFSPDTSWLVKNNKYSQWRDGIKIIINYTICNTRRLTEFSNCCRTKSYFLFSADVTGTQVRVIKFACTKCFLYCFPDRGSIILCTACIHRDIPLPLSYPGKRQMKHCVGHRKTWPPGDCAWRESPTSCSEDLVT